MKKPTVEKGSVLIRVTDDDIKYGVPGSSRYCALGRAFNRDFHESRIVHVLRDELYVFYGSCPKKGRHGYRTYKLTPEYVDLTIAIDLGDVVKPTDFGFNPDTGVFSAVVNASPLVQTPEEKRRDPFAEYDPTPAGQGVEE